MAGSFLCLLYKLHLRFRTVHGIATVMSDAILGRRLSRVRQGQREATREAVLKALRRRMEPGQLEDVSFAELANDADVGERTVYRHFPTREALLGDFWAWLHTQPLSDSRLEPARAAAPVDQKPMRILLATD